MTSSNRIMWVSFCREGRIMNRGNLLTGTDTSAKRCGIDLSLFDNLQAR